MPSSKPKANTDVLVLYSGGSDSSLAAIKLGQRYQRVHLLSFTRCGVFGQEYVEQQATRLSRFFGEEQERFHLRFIKVDKLFRFLLYERYLRHLMRHGFLVLTHCGLCKLSFHWRALLHCLERGITHIADGAVRTTNVYPAQNEVMMLRRLKEFYGGFGVHYETPIYEEGDTVEEILFRLRYNNTPKIKEQMEDLQMTCEQQILYAMFLRHYLPRVKFEEFEERVATFYEAKFCLMEEMTREYLDHGHDARLARLIES